MKNIIYIEKEFSFKTRCKKRNIVKDISLVYYEKVYDHTISLNQEIINENRSRRANKPKEIKG